MKIAQIEWFINNRKLFFTDLKAGRYKMRVLGDLMSGESPIPG